MGKPEPPQVDYMSFFIRSKQPLRLDPLVDHRHHSVCRTGKTYGAT